MAVNYIVLHVIDIIALLFLTGLLYSNNLLRPNRSSAFLCGILLTIAVIIADIGTVLVFEGSPDLSYFNIIFNVFGFALAPLIPIILISIFDATLIKKYYVLLLPTLINMVVVILSPIYGLIFYVDNFNNYQRGSIFLFFVIVYIFNIVLLLISILSSVRKSLYPIKWKIFTLTAFTVVGSFIQLLIPSVHSTWHCVTLALFLLYIILSEFDGSFDRLTQLYNRATFAKVVSRLKARNIFSVVVIDIDNFKSINDRYGHEYGDTVLREVSDIIRSSFNKDCGWYRMGGDEFYIICMDIKEEELKVMIKNMINQLSEKRINDVGLPTVSYGYSNFQSGGNFDFQNMLKEADDQMYYYKNLKNSIDFR